MHLICIGVVKKLIKLWIHGPLVTRCLPSQKIKHVSTFLCNIRNYIPREFARKPRGIEDYAQWKATECRQFLLYTGILVLKKELPSDIYSNFLSLHVAIRILCQKSTTEFIEYADKLLHHFVKCFIDIYGPEFVFHNIHGLLHLTDCVKKLGPLDTFSAFPFESFMKELKSVLRKAEKPLEQISNRYAEMTLCDIISDDKNILKINVKNVHYKGPLISGCFNPQYSKVQFPHFTLSINPPDNCCLIDKDIVCLENITMNIKGDYIVIGRKFEIVEELYNYPCSSTLLDIFKVNKLSTLQVWPLYKIGCKFMKLPHTNGYYVVIPLLNTIHS